MNFTQIVQEVISITKRPDKLNDIKRAVNATLNRTSIGANFARDLQERSIDISPSEYAHSIQLSEFSRFRKFEYIKPSNANRYLTQCPSSAIFVAVKKGNSQIATELLNKYYIAGDQVNFKLCSNAPSLLVGWYAYPPLLVDDTVPYWMLDVIPYIIIDGACAKIFGDIGDDQSAAAFESSYRLAYLQAITDLKSGARHG